ncbi:protein of unknown function (DUF3328) domain containing protein [Rhypophila decipiens]
MEKLCEAEIRLLQDDDLAKSQDHHCACFSERSTYLKPADRTRTPWQRANLFSLIILLLLFCNAVLLTAIFVVQTAGSISQSHHSSSPATFEDVINDDTITLPSLKDNLRYVQKREWENVIEYPWNLEPSDELDAAWHDLSLATDIRVSVEELDLIGENRTNAVRVTGGDEGHTDYLGSLGVYHNIHCLDSIRRKLSWEYYESRTPGNKKALAEPAHLAHCVDLLRQALTCHPSTALFVTDYVNDPLHYISEDIRSLAKVQCVDWDSLHGWAKGRALLPGQYKYKVGPWYKSPEAKNPNDW